MAIKGFRMACLTGFFILACACFAGDQNAQLPNEKSVGIFNSALDEKFEAVAYNFKDDEFLVICLMSGGVGGNRDVYGQFVKPDGSLKGGPFPICIHPADQSCPDVAYGTDNEFLVVWCDFRAPNGDIYGARLDASGRKLKNTNTVADTTFIICSQDSTQLNPRIAHNPVDNNYLVVWRDYRNSFIPKLQKSGVLPSSNLDLYGERLNAQGLAMAPGDPANTKVNYPVAVDRGYDEFYQDVVYCGGGKRPDEWLVVFVKYSLQYQLPASELIHGVRIDGKTGNWLDTWGNAIAPTLSQNTGAPVAPPWTPYFPIGSSGFQPTEEPGVTQIGPRVESNTGWLLHTGKAQALHPYPLPECLVVWTEFPTPAQIRAQRVAYFPDSTAFRRKFKTNRGTDGMFTLVPLDSTGHPANKASDWIAWRSLRVTEDAFHHDFDNISYNPISGDYLAVWNDWKSTGWKGTYAVEGSDIAPPADIAGRRLFLNPKDSSVVFMNQASAWVNAATEPIPIAGTSADEGNNFFPAIAYGYSGDQFLIAYEWESDTDNQKIDIQGTLFHGLPTAVRDLRNPGRAPDRFVLANNYPNPFNPGTTIDFQVPTAARTTVRILDALGRGVATLMDENRQAGQCTVQWDGSDAGGNPAASGVYFYRIQSGPHSAWGRMLLLR